MFLVTIIKFIALKILRFGRFLIVSGITFAAILYTIDSFTKSEYGIANLYLIAGALIFFPLFTGLFVEFRLREIRKGNRTIKKMNTVYLKEDAKKKSLIQ